MRYIKFGNYNSYEDFSLILVGMQIEQPEAKTEYVEIQGADGQLDLTEYFGEVKYSNRKLTFEFETKLRGQSFYDMFSKIANQLNGKRMNIIVDRDLNFYFNGRIQVSEYKSNELIGSVVIEADCDPYQMEVYETRNEFELKGIEREIVLVNLKKKATPIIEVTDNNGDINLIFEGVSYMLSGGTWTIPELLLSEGNNYIKLNGNGKISFTFRRGKL